MYLVRGTPRTWARRILPGRSPRWQESDHHQKLRMKSPGVGGVRKWHGKRRATLKCSVELVSIIREPHYNCQLVYALTGANDRLFTSTQLQARTTIRSRDETVSTYNNEMTLSKCSYHEIRVTFPDLVETIWAFRDL